MTASDANVASRHAAGAAGTPLASYLTRLIWLCLLPLLGLAAWLAYERLGDLETARREAAQRLSRNFAAAINQSLDERVGALEMLARSPLVDDPARRSELYQEAQGFQASFGSHVILADLEFRMLLNTRVPYGTPLPRLPLPRGRPAAPLALASGRPEVGDLLMGPFAREPLLAMVVPVLRQDRVVALLLTTFEARRFQSQLDQAALPAGWALTLRDSTDAVIARRGPPGLRPDDVDEDGRFVARLGRAPWSVLLEIPRTVYVGERRRTELELLAALLGASLVGAVGGALAGRRLGRAVAALGAARPPAAPPEIRELADLRRRLAEAAASLHESELSYRSLFDNMLNGFAYCQMLYDGDTAVDFVYLAVNAAFASQTGLRNVVGRRVSEVIPGIRESDPALIEGYGRVARGGRPEHFERYVNALRMWFSVSVYSPQVDHFVAVFDVITERKATEAALRQSEQRFRQLFRDAPLAMGIVDRDGRLVEVNTRFVQGFGYTLEDAPDLDTWWRLAYPDPTTRAMAQKAWQAATLQAHSVGVEFDPHERHITCKDGSLRTLLISGISLGEEYLAAFYDVTERRRAEDEVIRLNAGLEQRVADRTAELTAANAELDSFAYAVSHDLRAPLRAMSGFAQALEEDSEGHLPELARQDLEQIKSASRRMSDLIDGLLALSRLSRGDLEYAEVDLSTLARGMLEELARSQPERRVTTVVADGLTAHGDPRMLALVLQNLLDNAWKYTARSAAPEIRCYAEERDGRRWTCVADNGAGFAMEHASHLFQPFQRLHRQEEFPGLGIGLATVRRIVQRHGGRIEAAAEPGRGALFRFTLDTERTPS